jgi:hypothetical protein
MLRDHGAHVTLCVMSVQVGLLPMVLPTTQVSDLFKNMKLMEFASMGMTAKDNNEYIIYRLAMIYCYFLLMTISF